MLAESNISINYLSISGILVVLSASAAAVFVALQVKKSWASVIWIIFCIFVASWGFGLLAGFTVQTDNAALFWAWYLNLSAVFIPPLFTHFVVLYTGENSLKGAS